ncbi:MAG: hypothetical protein IPJ85_11950 [Flavobacteriales bacterium]|nr:hypothetical protein [Flavobacteriales bacterium]
MAGQGDVIAAPMHLDRAERKHFTVLEPFAEWEPMLVSVRPEVGDDADMTALLSDSVQLAEASPFAHHAYNGWDLKKMKPMLATGHARTEDELIEHVLLGEASRAIVSRLRSQLEAERFRSLRVRGDHWAMRYHWSFVIATMRHC